MNAITVAVDENKSYKNFAEYINTCIHCYERFAGPKMVKTCRECASPEFVKRIEEFKKQ